MAAAAVLATAGAAHGSFPGRNGLIAYDTTTHFCGRPCGRSHLFTIKQNGSGKRELTRTRSATEPAWSPDAAHIAYTSEFGSLLVVNAGGGKSRLFARRGVWPTYSPDGRFLAYRAGERVFAVWEKATSGSVKRMLIRNADQPDWSPNGRRIAFLRKLDVYVAGSGGRGARRWTHTGSAFYPTWSPDGKRIAFILSNGNSLAVVGRPGGPLRIVGRQAWPDTKPAWSPDGKRIAFVRGNADRGKAWLVTVPAHGGRVHKVTRVGYSDGISWAPR